MHEQIIDIPTKDGAMETFVVHPDRFGPHPPLRLRRLQDAETWSPIYPIAILALAGLAAPTFSTPRFS